MADRAHSMTGRIGHWPYCKTCGLIGLKNAASRREANASCPGPREQRLSGDAAASLWAKLRREGWREGAEPTPPSPVTAPPVVGR